jgi:PAS domain S-box-containing protein
LLKRQLKHAGLGAQDMPADLAAWQAFLSRLDATYAQADVDRYTLERSLDVSSTEMHQLYAELERASETALAVERDKLRTVNGFLDSIIGNIPDMIFVKDADTLKFVELNRAGEVLLGLRRDDLVGKGDDDFFPPDQAAFFVAKDREVLANGTLQDIPEEPIETPRGVRLLHTKKIPIHDDQGRPRYLLGISRDITDAKLAEQLLREAKELAEKASRAKSGFLSNMSHEMRTPLNAILGFARVLDTGRFGPLTDRQREYLDYILRAGKHMLNLVNDLLDLRRIEEDRAALAVTRVSIDAVVAEALEMVKPLVEEKRHAVAVSVDPALPAALADRRAVVQILVNLLANAAKFTPESGRIEVAARVVEQAVVVAVQDSGVGIRPEDQPKLFTYFEQLGAKHEHHMQGSGIGLALTRALVERLGGAIHVRSAPGTGSTFEFSIPRWTEAA